MIKNILFLLFFVFMVVDTAAQNLDSLYTTFLQVRTGTGDRKLNSIYISDKKIKCGFELVNEIKSNLRSFSKEQQRTLTTLLQRPEAETSIVSPGGYFRIHYDLTGTNSPAYDINDLALSLDTVYNYEINELGYPPPPSDGNAGGDDLYDVYIQSLNRGLYGYTEIENDLPGDRHTSFIVMENSYEGYYTEGIFGAKVTAAHEFHHAIQIGGYIYRSSDMFYYEITSSAMEEFVFDYINDYYAYMDFYFAFPEKTFATRNTSLDGYDLAVWNIYLKDRFGADIIRDIWEVMRQERALVAMAMVLEDYNSSFKYELNNFGLWTYFTGPRTKIGEYFEEAENYPPVKPLGIYNYTPPASMPMIINSQPMSNNFLVYVDESQGNSDTLVAIITNADINSGTHALYPPLEFKHQILSGYEAGAVKINDRYYSLLECLYEDYIRESYIFNNEPTSGGATNDTHDEFAFPQPFSYANPNYNFIRVPAASNQGSIADLNVYSTSMDLVYSASLDIYGSQKKYVKWNGLDKNNKKLPTGIYIYVTNSGDTIKKGKIVVYNE